jgi:hypothetical protein
MYFCGMGLDPLATASVAFGTPFILPTLHRFLFRRIRGSNEHPILMLEALLDLSVFAILTDTVLGGIYQFLQFICDVIG